MKCSIASGTAYYRLSTECKSSKDTFPIDDAFILFDRSHKRPIGFMFDTNSSSRLEWLNSWESYEGGIQKFLSNLALRDNLELVDDVFFISGFKDDNVIIKVAASAYVDIDDSGNPTGIEFLFKATEI